MDGGYSVYAILPPYNTIHAQLVKSSGVLVTSASGITVIYEAVADPSGSINTHSDWKTNFWKFAQPLFGTTLASGVGLTGYAMPGKNNTPQAMTFEAAQDWFTATAIPLTPYDDSGNNNPYPVMRLTARDSSGATLATTVIVLPVSDEMSGRLCHASGSSNLVKPAAGWANDPQTERSARPRPGKASPCTCSNAVGAGRRPALLSAEPAFGVDQESAGDDDLLAFVQA